MNLISLLTVSKEALLIKAWTFIVPFILEKRAGCKLPNFAQDMILFEESLGNKSPFACCQMIFWSPQDALPDIGCTLSALLSTYKEPKSNAIAYPPIGTPSWVLPNPPCHHIVI
nr:hypothetical protein [Providencia sp. G1(2023)]